MEMDAPADHVGHDLRAAFVGHAGHVDLFPDLEPFADQLRRGSLGEAEGELARIGIRIGDEFRDGVGWDRLFDHRQPVPEHGIGDRDEALERIVARVLVHRRGDHDA